tara:strand:- start:3969 stop:4562 length:594 start_codon:yes stop_codon:yes gene_type:complete
MKNIYFLFIFMFLLNCSKSKTVLICGDHVCVNKVEANQYFEENLSIEVKVIEKKTGNSFDLLELNLKEDQGKREINIFSKKNIDKNVKVLSKKEISIIKENIKNKKKGTQIAKKIYKKDKLNKKKPEKITENLKKINVKNEGKKIQKDKIIKNNQNEIRKDVFDVCTILEKCNIEEISKYLIKHGKNKGFPDLTKRP